MLLTDSLHKKRQGARALLARAIRWPYPLQFATKGCQVAQTNLCVHIQWGRVDEKVQCNTQEHCSDAVVIYSLNCVWLSAAPWTGAHQAALSMGILRARTLEWAAMPFSRGSSQPRNRTHVSCTAGRFFIIWATWEATLVQKIALRSNLFLK